ncbi:MAG: FAD-dependent monooxygenase [Chloroflexia bacterium]|nr:FAD-dependent monooxygenase [Chloroflexia bacterium]
MTDTTAMIPGRRDAAKPDVAIVGGGVTGSALAIVLRRQGLGVHLIERREEFRDRIRGETIHPWGASELRRLDLYDLAISNADALPQHFWQTYRDRQAQPPYRWADDFPDAPNGLGVNHVALQHALIDEAARRGAVIHRPATISFGREAGRPNLVVMSPSGETRLQPRLVVGADGQNSATRTWAGGIAWPDTAHHHLGGALIRGLGLASDRVHHAFFEGGFVFVSPQAKDVARLYLVCSNEAAMQIQTSADPARQFVERFRDSLPEGVINETWKSIGPAGFFPNANVPVTLPSLGDVVLIGDSSGRNDPSQGHGLSIAFHDVRILAGMLTDQHDWTTVPDRFHAAKARSFETLRQHALWNERHATETGPDIDELRARIARARELDPTAGGFAAIFATGPEGLAATDAARRHYFGLDLVESVATASA